MEAFEQFFEGYLEAMAFTDLGDDGQPPAESEVTPAYRTAAREDCQSFWRTWGAAIRASNAGADQAGRDFWFTRQGHGVGFWDRDADMYGKALQDALTEASENFGEAYPDWQAEI